MDHSASARLPAATANTQLLVTGASGQLGKRVIHHLLHTLQVPPQQLIVTTRNPSEVAELAALGVDVRTADFNTSVEVLAGAFYGASRMLLISTDQQGTPGLRLQQHKRAIAAAVKAGIAHVVYTSMPSPNDSAVTFAPDHAGSEEALGASKLRGWTILRNHWYFENWYRSIPDALRLGRWYSAAAEGRLANISRDDIGRAAAMQLASSETEKRTYTLSGAEALTTREVATTISAVVGKPLAVIDVPVAGLVQGLMARGLPETVAREIASFDANTAAGGFALATNDFRTITGREPLRLADWCTANRVALSRLR